MDSLHKKIEEIFPGKPFLKVEDITQLLGCDAAVVYAWTKRTDPKRRPPRIIVGKELRFPTDGFIQWLADVQGR